MVTGPPASGKTTIADTLSQALHVPVFTKDGFKERLFDALGTGDRDWSRTLGRTSLDLLLDVVAEELRAGRAVIAEANFWRSYDTARFHALPDHRMVQIHVSAPPDVLIERYRRRERHTGHLGATVVPELEAGLEAGEWAPLDLGGELLEIDTSTPPELGQLTAWVRDRIR